LGEGGIFDEGCIGREIIAGSQRLLMLSDQKQEVSNEDAQVKSVVIAHPVCIKYF